MWIFGYNESKQVIEVDVPMETILAEQIDPWQLDLFDPEPVICDVGRHHKLHFRRLKEITFGYKQNEKGFICMHDGSRPVCLEGDLSYIGFIGMAIKSPRLSPTTFGEHLRRYAGLFDGARSFEEVNGKIAGPRNLRSLTIASNEIRLDKEDELLGRLVSPLPYFTGKMFEQLTLSMSLPRDWNWVFENLQAAKPLILGESLRHLLLKPNHNSMGKRIEFWIDHQSVSPTLQLLRELPEVTNPVFDMGTQDLRFSRKGIAYRARLIAADIMLSIIKKPAFSDHETFSLDCLYATGVNKVYASRIALFDSSQSKIRAVSISALRKIDTSQSCRETLGIPKECAIESLRYYNPDQNRTAIQAAQEGRLTPSMERKFMLKTSRALAA